MFDSNMRHLPKGHKFIAKFWGCKEDTVLFKHGVRKDDLCLCTMLEDETNNPEVLFHFKDGDVKVRGTDEGLFAYHALYWGTVNEDGTLDDFRYEHDLEEAKQFMEKYNAS